MMYKNEIMRLENMGNKEFIFECIELLVIRGKMDGHILSLLCDGKWCKDMGFMARTSPILKKVPDDCTASGFKALLLDNGRKNRYYSNPFTINGEKYILTNYWYGPQAEHPDNRTPFLQWIGSILA